MVVWISWYVCVLLYVCWSWMSWNIWIGVKCRVSKWFGKWLCLVYVDVESYFFWVL